MMSVSNVLDNQGLVSLNNVSSLGSEIDSLMADMVVNPKDIAADEQQLNQILQNLDPYTPLAFKQEIEDVLNSGDPQIAAGNFLINQLPEYTVMSVKLQLQADLANGNFSDFYALISQILPVSPLSAK